MKTLTHAFEYLILRLLQVLASLLPRRVALVLGGLSGTLLYQSGVYRKVVRKNLAYVALWSPAEIEEIEKKLYKTMCRYVVDFLRVSKTKPEHRVHDYDVVGRVLDRGKGAVVLLGHFGNWELLADLFGAKLDLRVVAKPMRNLLVDKWLARKRDAASVKTIFVDQALRKIYEGIKSNALVAVLIDQNAGSQGTQVSFLGREASTVRTVAGLVNKTGCGVIPCYALLRDDGSYDVVIAEAPPLDLAGMSDEECIAAYQIQHNGILSEWIRRNPEHWFGWFHRRWREHVEYD